MRALGGMEPLLHASLFTDLPGEVLFMNCDGTKNNLVEFGARSPSFEIGGDQVQMVSRLDDKPEHTETWSVERGAILLLPKRAAEFIKEIAGARQLTLRVADTNPERIVFALGDSSRAIAIIRAGCDF